jgi:hypothetical protein
MELSEILLFKASNTVDKAEQHVEAVDFAFSEVFGMLLENGQHEVDEMSSEDAETVAGGVFNLFSMPQDIPLNLESNLNLPVDSDSDLNSKDLAEIPKSIDIEPVDLLVPQGKTSDENLNAPFLIEQDKNLAANKPKINGVAKKQQVVAEQGIDTIKQGKQYSDSVKKHGNDKAVEFTDSHSKPQEPEVLKTVVKQHESGFKPLSEHSIKQTNDLKNIENQQIYNGKDSLKSTQFFIHSFQRQTAGEERINQKDLTLSENKAYIEQTGIKTFGTIEPETAKSTDKIVPEKIFNQIIEKAQVMLKHERSEISLQLKPESLGKLSLFLSVEKGVLCGRILVNNPQVGDVLQGGIPELKQALQQHGIDLSKMEIGYSGEGLGSSGGEHRESYNRNRYTPLVLEKTETFVETYDVKMPLGTINYFV